MVSEAEKRRRVDVILRRLGAYSAEKAAAILALDDRTKPNPIKVMAGFGFTLADGATNRALLDEVSRRLGRGQLDREYRDYIQLPLRELGILGKATADPTNQTFIQNYWMPKSNHCVSVLTPEFRNLLHASTDTFDEQLAAWIGSTDARLTRMKSAEAKVWEDREGGRLVPLTINAYCADILADYEVLFVDDQDSDRISPVFEANIKRYNLPLGLHTRWPDIILRQRMTGRFWIVDAVESDGEVDEVRRQEMETDFANAGLIIDGFTTAYRTLKRFRERQAANDNIALNTYVWIAELGGAHFLKTRTLN